MLYLLWSQKQKWVSIQLFNWFIQSSPFTIPEWCLIIDSILETDFFFSTFMSIRMNLLFLISLPGHSLLNYLKDALWNFSNCLHIKCKINLWWIMQFDWTTLFPGLKNSSQKECVIMAELTGRESKKKTPDLCLHYIWLTKVQVPDYSKGLSLSHF